MRGRISISGAVVTTLVALLGLIVSCGPAGAVTQYTITDLGTLGGDSSGARAINELGQVVGTAEDASGDDSAFLWLPAPAYGLSGGMHSLGTLGGPWSYGYDINDSGQVVGESHYDTSWKDHAFLWLPAPAYGLSAGMHDLGTLGGPSSEGCGINESGQVVGLADTAISHSGNYENHAYLWENGVMGDLGAFGGRESRARGINDSGQVVGDVFYIEGHWDNQYRAFLWDGAVHDLGDFGGVRNHAQDVNASGQVVGSAETASWVSRAFLWESGVMYDIGDLGGGYANAAAINDPGQVVGSSSIAGGDDHAFLWENGVMYDLNSLIVDGSGWVVTWAGDVNDRGEIVGSGTINGERHAFLLTPIPEPSVLGLAGFAFLVVMRRLRHGAVTND